MNRGYTLFWRKTWDNPVLHERGKRFSKREAWMHITNVLAQGVERDGLKRGEFRASYRYLAKAWLWSVDSVFRFMRALEAENMIRRPERAAEHQPERAAEHFIVCNYELYNPPPNTNPNAQPNAEPNKLKKVLKKVLKKEEKEDAAADAAAVDSLPCVEAYRLSELLRTAIARRDPHSKAAKLPDITHWARDIDKLLRIDGRRSQDVEAVIAWCQEDSFWAPNVLSGRKLREKFDQLFGQMSRKPGASNADHKPTASPGFTSRGQRLFVPGEI